MKGRMVFFCMHPLNNVPPPLNAAIYFGRNGYQVIVLAYHDHGLPRMETLGLNAKLLRVNLRSRNIGISLLRYVFAIAEYLSMAKKIVKRLRPDLLICFNEIAAIINHPYFAGKVATKVTWLLEFPENLERSLGKSILFSLSERSWKHADIVIAPTRERLAMACVLQPALIHKPMLVVHNASLLDEPSQERVRSDRFYEVERFAKQAKASGYITIIYAGAIGNRYGLHQLIEAVGNSHYPFSLLVLGKKHDLALREYTAALQQVTNPQRVHWIDSIDYREMKIVLPWFDIGYVTYIGDTLNTYFAAPGKLYEYLKASLIILADNGITIIDDLRDRNCGIFFSKPVSTQELGARLEDVARQPDTVSRMKHNARALFEAKFSFEAQLKPFADFIDRSSEK